LHGDPQRFVVLLERAARVAGRIAGSAPVVAKEEDTGTFAAADFGHLGESLGVEAFGVAVAAGEVVGGGDVGKDLRFDIRLRDR
jgi:hypothetical protein